MNREQCQHTNHSILSEEIYGGDGEWILDLQLHELVEQGVMTDKEADECREEFIRTNGLSPEKPKQERYDVV